MTGRIKRDHGCPAPGTGNALRGWAGTAGSLQLRAEPGQPRESWRLAQCAPEPGGSRAGRAPRPSPGKPQVSAPRGAGAETQHPGGRHGASRATGPYASHPRPEVAQERPPTPACSGVRCQAPRGCPGSSPASAKPGPAAAAPLPPRRAPGSPAAPTHRAGSGESLAARRPGCSVLGGGGGDCSGGRRERSGEAGCRGGAAREGARGRGRERGGDPGPEGLQRLHLPLGAPRAAPAPGGGARGRVGLGHLIPPPPPPPRVGAAPSWPPSVGALRGGAGPWVCRER